MYQNANNSHLWWEGGQCELCMIVNFYFMLLCISVFNEHVLLAKLENNKCHLKKKKKNTISGLLNQKLHFSQISGLSVCTFKSEKHRYKGQLARVLTTTHLIHSLGTTILIKFTLSVNRRFLIITETLFSSTKSS